MRGGRARINLFGSKLGGKKLFFPARVSGIPLFLVAHCFWGSNCLLLVGIQWENGPHSSTFLLSLLHSHPRRRFSQQPDSPEWAKQQQAEGPQLCRLSFELCHPLTLLWVF